VRGVLIPKIVATDDLFAMVERVLIDHEYAAMDELIIVTAGIPSLRRGTTNMIKVHRVGARAERERN
jgi:pyruvate kinase